MMSTASNGILYHAAIFALVAGLCKRYLETRHCEQEAIGCSGSKIVLNDSSNALTVRCIGNFDW